MLVRIMVRARILVSVEEQEELIAPIFKTVQNGNLDIFYSDKN
ncbi:RsfA family transcriptional regulator, partial [Bacillus thuringiensis]